MIKLLIPLIFFSLSACTELEKAKNFGGTATLNLPKGEKLIHITWKEHDLWYLTREMKPNDSVETYYFREESGDNGKNGSVIIHEQKQN